MGKEIKARGLADVNITPTDKKHQAVIALTNVDRQVAAFIINPEGLGVLLERALGLAADWADEPDLDIHSLTGGGNALPARRMSFQVEPPPETGLPAQRISLERGRDDVECAVRVSVGKVELTFLIPLNEVLKASAALIRKIEPIDELPSGAGGERSH